LLLFHFLIFLYLLNKFSQNVLYAITAGEFVINFVLLTICFSYRYATEYEDTVIFNAKERLNSKVKQGIPLDEKSLEDLYSSIRTNSGENCLNYLQNNVQLENGNAFVFASTDPFLLKYIPRYQYSTIIQLERLNNIKGINKMLFTANDILPENGLLICCFESKSTHKKRLLNKHFNGINYFVYCINYLFKRIFPKLFLTRWLYFVITGGTNRILSKAEVLGRFYFCGYKIEKEKKIGQLNYVFARRIKEPETTIQRTYGPLIRLKRFGKHGKPFNVYKMRTMHPYSEYLQSYIYDRHKLKDGGKFNKDIRITTFGKIMRKFWLDEFPMIFNILKGDMKLVGVRPLSSQYFNLYSKELQEKRIKFKPGLFPPFYADMPVTLTEIQESEMRYLLLCETKSPFLIDIYYLFLILKNILIKKARSA
jgi:lipopolysaccharide/colanic/teichoic acid biosynthesis glycosyltransferase